MTGSEMNKLTIATMQVEALREQLANAQATVGALQAQLPAEMQGCTILFKECEKGHGRLTATNWIDHGCQTCVVEALQREHNEAGEALERQVRTLTAALDAEREKVRELEEKLRVNQRAVYAEGKVRELLRDRDNLESQLSQLQALVRAAVERWRAQTNVKEGISFRMVMKALEATLDATTPARGGQDEK